MCDYKKNESHRNYRRQYINFLRQSDQDRMVNFGNLYEILKKLISNYQENNYGNTIHSISELHRYLRNTAQIPIEQFNISGMNFLFFDLLQNPLFTLYYDNIFRVLIILVSTPGFDLTPFIDINFINFLFSAIFPVLRDKSNIFSLYSILITKVPPKIIISNDSVQLIITIYHSCNDFLTQLSIIRCLTVIVERIDANFENEIILIVGFVQSELTNLTKSAPEILSLFSCCFECFPFCAEKLLQDFPYQALYEMCQFSNEPLQIEIMKLIQSFANFHIENAFAIFRWDYFCFALHDESSERVKTGFFQMAISIIKFRHTIYTNIEIILPIILNSFHNYVFPVKSISLKFLSKLIYRIPNIVASYLLVNGYMDILDLFLQSSDENMLKIVLKSYIYLIEIAHDGIFHDQIMHELDKVILQVADLETKDDKVMALVDCFLSLFFLSVNLDLKVDNEEEET